MMASALSALANSSVAAIPAKRTPEESEVKILSLSLDDDDDDDVASENNFIKVVTSQTL